MNKIEATLEVLELELTLRLIQSGSLVHTCRDGKQIPVKDMELSHLINTVNYFKRVEREKSFFSDFDGFDINDLS